MAILNRVCSSWLCVALLGAVVCSSARAGAPADDVALAAHTIDEHMARGWEAAGVPPTEPASDAEFLRRVYLDVVGKIPPVLAVRTFLDDDSTGKRRAAVDALLADHPSYVPHWTTFWRKAYLPEAENNLQLRFLAPSFDVWLRKQLMEEVGYDAMVRELLTAPLNGNQGRVFNPYQQTGDPTPYAFYQAKEMKPENLAAATARLFLGIRVECAQCHDHPFARWTREDFWSHAAFFAGAERPQQEGFIGAVREIFDRRELAIPDTQTVVQARYIDGGDPEWQYKVPARQTLAEWVTSPENPYFARATVNRIWGHFFGTGLVDPIDDFGEDNPPSHPELLDALAADFAAHDFDIKFLIRAITASRTYQLSSRQTHLGQADPRLFARSAVRGLTGEQIFDSLAEAVGFREPAINRNPFVFGVNSPRQEFMQNFGGDPDKPTERQTSIVQALTMMNSFVIAGATGPEQSRSLAAVIQCPLFDTPQRVEAVYLLTLSRKPRPDELERLVAYVDSGGAEEDPARALGDVFWALLNSSEFLFNH